MFLLKKSENKKMYFQKFSQNRKRIETERDSRFYTKSNIKSSQKKTKKKACPVNSNLQHCCRLPAVIRTAVLSALHQDYISNLSYTNFKIKFSILKSTFFFCQKVEKKQKNGFPKLQSESKNSQSWATKRSYIKSKIKLRKKLKGKKAKIVFRKHQSE